LTLEDVIVRKNDPGPVTSEVGDKKPASLQILNLKKSRQ